MNRSRRGFLQGVGTAGMVLGVQAGVRSSKDPLNFIIINVDDLGVTDVACFGSTYYETPHIDALCADSIKFTEAYAACAVCSPTRAAMMTGRYPARLGLTDWIRPDGDENEVAVSSGKAPTEWKTEKGVSCPPNPFWLELSEITLAEQLKTVGYTTGHIGKWHLGDKPWFPKKQGFDENYGGCDLGMPPSYFDPYTWKTSPRRIEHLPPRKEGEFLTDRESDEACGFIKKHAGHPFYLNMWHYAVHTPIQGKPEVVAKYAKKEKTNQKKPEYAALVESVDDAVGRLVGTLKELKIYDRTVIFFTSDNGGLNGPTSNAPYRSGKGFPYEGGIRIPQTCRWPGVTKAGSVCDTPVISIDFFPTICAGAGVPLPADREIDGQDLMPLLKGGTIDRDAIYWHFPHFRPRTVWPYSIIRKGDWKLLYRYSPIHQPELYNLKEDIGEENDLAATMPEKVKELKTQLEAYLKAVGAKVPIIVDPNWNPEEEPEKKKKKKKKSKKKK